MRKAADSLATVLMIMGHNVEISTKELVRLLAVSEDWRRT